MSRITCFSIALLLVGCGPTPLFHPTSDDSDELNKKYQALEAICLASGQMPDGSEKGCGPSTIEFCTYKSLAYDADDKRCVN